jgi:hypothetical protein
MGLIIVAMRAAHWSCAVVTALAMSGPAGAQAPPVARPAPPRTAPAPPTQPASRPAATPATAPAPWPLTSNEPAPDEALLGVPVFPGARFLRSYDAGQGQRYYLFASTAGFAELVTYYRNALKTRGELVYDIPPVHMFEVGRFREETMAFPPGVTIKDYTGGGIGGYLDPRPGASPQRYPTVIQIVPVPPADRKR